MYPRHAFSIVIAAFAFLAGQSSCAEPHAARDGKSPAKDQPARVDHYGDPLPKGARFRLGTVRLRHDGDVMALAWLPDGRTLASASWDRTVRLWQIPSGKQLAQWDNREGVVFSPDGRSLACGDGNPFGEEEEVIRIVNVATGKERRRLPVRKTGGALSNVSARLPFSFLFPQWKDPRRPRRRIRIRGPAVCRGQRQRARSSECNSGRLWASRSVHAG